MKKLYLLGIIFFGILLSVSPKNTFSQTCDSLTATYIETESRCAATGSVQINASGGSGTYEYKAVGPVVTNYTSSSLITGLSAGRYLIIIRDVINNCIYDKDSITIAGDYLAPNFTMLSTDVTCINGNDGVITVTSQSFGRGPFLYKIIAPSASGVGTVNATGIFTGLTPGNYLIQLTDSCGAIQTRGDVIQNYDWIIKNYTVTKISCDSVAVSMILRDSRGKETPDSVFNGFLYGAAVIPGDTTWFSSNTFTYFKGNKRSVKLFAKDKCGNIKWVTWVDTNVPRVNAAVLITNKTCADFTAAITGQVNLTNPEYCIYDTAQVLISCNNTGSFTMLPYGSYCIKITDKCYDTTITRCFTVNKPVPGVSTTVQITTSCKDFTATIAGQTNLNNPYYCLYDSSDILLYCDSTGSFTNLTYGSRYCIKIINDPACYDTVITRCFTALRPVPSVDANVRITDKICQTYTATVTGQTNLNNPNYCLYDANDVLLYCDSSGVFPNLLYGTKYCIKIFNYPACYDTVIVRCFVVDRPEPSAGPDVKITNLTCLTFTATITDTLNLNNARYCIYTPAHVLIICNNTGVFDDLPYGTYCIEVVNDSTCYDTTIVRCFTVNRPVPSVGAVVNITDLNCSTFTAAAADIINLNDPEYCLYTAAHVLIKCNTTGIFDSLAYGSYCIEIANNPKCYDTTIIRCFTVNKPVPSINAAPAITNKNCTSFTATVIGQANIYNALYCIYDSLNVLVSCNRTGVFPNLTYGNYCIQVKNNLNCYDTIIRRCFSVLPPVATITVSARKSCATLGASNLRVNFDSGTPDYSVSLYSPAGVLLQTVTTSNSSYTFLSLPNLAAPQQYKIVVTDQCGSKDSALVTPNISIVNRRLSVTQKCPSGIWPIGSSDVIIDISNNIGGSITPKIIKRNGAPVSINASSNIGYKYTFLDLSPATYIFDTYIDDCNKHVYDTVEVRIYLFPILSSSNAYQCDNNGFVVSAKVQGGVGPYMYEIIGSVPASPGIVTAPQASPVFSINNGTVYSLVRLRVLDGCGNAALYDVSVLPLANLIVTADSPQCFNNSLTLRVDSIANADYTWYKRILPNDSIIVGTGATYHIPVLTLSDTGRYFCKVVVNSGCLIKYANYVITGYCYIVLPNDVTLNGIKQKEGNRLYWDATAANDREYALQRSDKPNGPYQTISTTANSNQRIFSVLDNNPAAENNFYRLKITGADNKIKYSNIVSLKNTKFDITVFPNPVENMLFISLKSNTAKNYLVEINSITGQKIRSQTYHNVRNMVVDYPRNATTPPGIYTVTITDMQSNEKQTYKVVYK
jgi:Secretion system C-terminal sorting domain